MGLAVYAFSKARFLHSKDKCDDGECLDCGYKIYPTAEQFESRLDKFEAGCYMPDENSKEFSFCNVMYSSYVEWRDLLCTIIHGVDSMELMLNPENYENAPFYELIFMSDSMGAIGPKTSAKLALDFAKFREFFKERLPTFTQKGWCFGSFEYAMGLYDDWHKGLMVASEEGFIVFK